MKTIDDLSGKQKKSVAFLAILIVGVTYLMLAFIAPRAELSVKTVVHKSFSGISVGITITNTGTIVIEDAIFNVTVTDKYGEIEYSENVDIGDLSRNDKTTRSFNFRGPQVETHNFTLRFIYTCDNKDYNESVSHEMGEYMNIVWEDSIRDWRF